MRTAAPKRAPGVPGRRDVILQLLRDSSQPRSIAEIADELAVHPNTVRFHLDALISAQRVEQLIGDTAGPGRPPVLFRAARRMDPAGPTNYRLVANILTNHFASSTDDPVAAAAELGRSWGPSLVEPSPGRALSKTQAVIQLVDVLDDLGFKPEPPPARGAKAIRLRHCPFHDLVDTHGTMICALHLGLMQGALTGMRGPVTVDRLDPLVEPDLCVAHLASATSGSGKQTPRNVGTARDLATTHERSSGHER
ncbi:helix-turn-helix transcriptional regulator [Mycobacterium bourgelatii]|uniref:ArsR family transcriptional regulator n=1 Tax=Mycobacterium bourgelatii TaxID=1273442 RepID=A0A7I9YIC0_MYCBU|nr:helix-turn-helix domain-containing protein [Mycobacterium bourgelatii]MCV6978012.1 HTH domain-containing protein [Mycobacterium bourgelatii]GFG88420.1 ArsR family transcriptional regulator [Mycobacterium bourgelatii]